MDFGENPTLAVPQKAQGPAMILALATATPPYCFEQSQYADYYFRVTSSERMKELKDKFKRICEKSAVEKRYMHITEDILKQNPILCSHNSPSLSTRQKILTQEVPKLGLRAALVAIKEWNRPKSEITHLVFCAIQGVQLPGHDHALTHLLGLEPSVKRVMLYHHGCYASVTALRLAKDIAENNKHARVLVVCSDMTVGSFRGPNEDDVDNLQMQAMLADGAAAVVVGADVDHLVEKPLFEILTSAQIIVPDTDNVIRAFVKEDGFFGENARNLPALIADNIEICLRKTFESMGIEIKDWNSIFWSMQGTVSPIVDNVEAKLKLRKDKLRASRSVLRENGYVMSASSLFVLNEIRKTSINENKGTTGDGIEYGVLIGFGAGVTIEAVALRSVRIDVF